MKLVSESPLEDYLLVPVTALLDEFKIDAVPVLSCDAIAEVFWSADDFFPSKKVMGLSIDDRKVFLTAIEEEIRSAMILAAYKTIDKCAEKYIVED